MTELLRFFWLRYRARTIGIVALLWLAALLDFFSLSSLLPLLHSLTSTAAREGREFMVLHVLGLYVPPALPVLLGLITLLLVAKGLVRWLAMRQVAMAAVNIAHGLRAELHAALLAASWRFFVQTPAGHLATAVGVEAYRAAFAYRRACAALVAALQVAFTVTLVVTISAWAGLSALLIGGAMAFVLRAIVHTSRAAGTAQTESTRTLAARVTDAAHTIKPARSMNRSAGIARWLEEANTELRRAEAQQLRASEALHAAHEPLIALAVAITLYLAYLFSGQSAAALLMLGFLFYRVLQQVSAFLLEYQGVVLGEASFRAIRAQVESARAMPEQTGVTGVTGRVIEFGRELQVCDVEFAYDRELVVRGVEFTVRFGSLFLITGPSGAGKTTLLDLIAGLYRPARGSILVDGVPLAQLDLHAWRRQLGYVTQEPALLHASIHDNLTLGDNIAADRLRAALVQAGAAGFVDALPEGWQTLVGEQGLRLSGGQRQRLALARALVHEPRLLLLDEPTANVDPETQEAVVSALAELKGRQTIIVVSHHPAFERIADSVLNVTEEMAAYRA